MPMNPLDPHSSQQQTSLTPAMREVVPPQYLNDYDAIMGLRPTTVTDLAKAFKRMARVLPIGGAPEALRGQA